MSNFEKKVSPVSTTYFDSNADAFIYLELIDPENNHKKFWEARVQGFILTTRWGRIGTTGQVKETEFLQCAEAFGAYQRQALAKMDKGYKVNRETGGRMAQVNDTLAALRRD